MSTTDKTRNKLMDSMRKTKASATEKVEPAVTKESVEKKQPQQSKPAAATKPAKVAAKKPTTKTSDTATGRYQTVRRVWPD